MRRIGGMVAGGAAVQLASFASQLGFAAGNTPGALPISQTPGSVPDISKIPQVKEVTVLMSDNGDGNLMRSIISNDGTKYVTNPGLPGSLTPMNQWIWHSTGGAGIPTEGVIRVPLSEVLDLVKINII